MPTETGCVEVGISAGNWVNLETKTEGIVSSLPGKKRKLPGEFDIDGNEKPV